MATAKRENYSEELTAAIVERYQAGETVEAIAESINKAVRSVRSKLVREGVYVAAEKPVKSKREEGPTKKELLRSLEKVVPHFPIDGFNGATKEALTALIVHLQAEVEVSTADHTDESSNSRSSNSRSSNDESADDSSIGDAD